MAAYRGGAPARAAPASTVTPAARSFVRPLRETFAEATNVGVADQVMLHDPTEDAFVDNLRQRFERNVIYVRSGVLLLWWWAPSRNRADRRRAPHRPSSATCCSRSTRTRR